MTTQAERPSISIIILNWNAADDTIHCVQRLLTWAQIRPHIWVIDNASHGDDAERIAQACPVVHLIHNDSNLGFAGGSNRGITEALAAGTAPLLLLNNDAAIGEAAMIRLLSTLEATPEVGIVGPLLYDGERLITAGNKNPVLHHINLLRTVQEREQPYAVDYISGSVALCRAEMLQAVGLLDEAYFFTGEVADLCRRARQNGFQTVVEPRAQANHHLARSSPLRSTLYTYYIVRNRFLYIRKFYRRLAPLLMTVWAVYGVILSVRLYLARQTASARAVWLGSWDGLRGRFGGQNKRVMGASAPEMAANGEPALANPHPLP